MDGTVPRTARRLIVCGVGGDLFDALDDILPFGFAAAALLAIAGAAYERRAAAGGMEGVRELERTLSDSEAKRLKPESRVRDGQEALRHEQQTRLWVQRARQAEREWARELREQV
jgi:hypothetical protein